MTEKWRPGRKHRRMPYFKVQSYNDKDCTWRDINRGFDTVDEADAYISGNLPDDKSRLMIVERTGRRVYKRPDNDDSTDQKS